MSPTHRRKPTVVLAASGVGHLAVLSLLALTHPAQRPAEVPPAFDVELVPVFMPPRRDHATEPVRAMARRPLRPRRVLRPDEATSAAPLVTSSAGGARRSSARPLLLVLRRRALKATR